MSRLKLLVFMMILWQVGCFVDYTLFGLVFYVVIGEPLVDLQLGYHCVLKSCPRVSFQPVFDSILFPLELSLWFKKLLWVFRFKILFQVSPRFPWLWVTNLLPLFLLVVFLLFGCQVKKSHYCGVFKDK